MTDEIDIPTEIGRAEDYATLYRNRRDDMMQGLLDVANSIPDTTGAERHTTEQEIAALIVKHGNPPAWLPHAHEWMKQNPPKDWSPQDEEMLKQ